MTKKNIQLVTKESAEKALEQLEKEGHKHLRSFIQFINNPESLKTPLGPSKNCLSIDSARHYVENMINKNNVKASPVVSAHLSLCEFCGNLVSQIPEPEITPKLWGKIKGLIKRKSEEEAELIHSIKINKYVRSVCLEFPGNTTASDILPHSILIDNQPEPVKKVSIADCDGDKKEELKVVFNKNALKRRRIFRNTYRLTCSSRSGKSFFALMKSLD